MSEEGGSLYVSNLNYNSEKSSIMRAFRNCIDLHIVTDRETGQSKGFGFVKFNSAQDAQACLEELGGPGASVNVDGREIKVNKAHSRDQKEGRSGYGGGGRGGGGYRGGRGGGGRGGFSQGGSWNQGGGYGQQRSNYGQDQSGGWSGQSQGYDQGNYGNQSYGQTGGYGQASYSQQSYGGQQQGWGGYQ